LYASAQKAANPGKANADRKDFCRQALFGYFSAPSGGLKQRGAKPGLAPVLLRFSGKLRFSCKCRVRHRANTVSVVRQRTKNRKLPKNGKSQ